jgi:hypothetical protein
MKEYNPATTLFRGGNVVYFEINATLGEVSSEASTNRAVTESDMIFFFRTNRCECDSEMSVKQKKVKEFGNFELEFH